MTRNDCENYKPPNSVRGWRPVGDGKLFRDTLDNNLTQSSTKHILDLEKILWDTAISNRNTPVTKPRPDLFQSSFFQNLLSGRRQCRNVVERSLLSKTIRKHTRQILRKNKSARMNEIFDEFEDLNRLEAAKQFPIYQ